MHRSSSNTRVADDYYKNNNSSAFSSSASSLLSGPADGNGNGNGNGTGTGNLPMYNPGSHVAKKEKSRLRSAENAVHLIPLVLVLCAITLWVFSNPVDVVNKRPDSVLARVEGLKGAGGVDIDGTQNNMLSHMELEEDSDLLHQHHRQTTELKPFF